jgi:hypothetical protein
LALEWSISAHKVFGGVKTNGFLVSVRNDRTFENHSKPRGLGCRKSCKFPVIVSTILICPL